MERQKFHISLNLAYWCPLCILATLGRSTGEWASWASTSKISLQLVLHPHVYPSMVHRASPIAHPAFLMDQAHGLSGNHEQTIESGINIHEIWYLSQFSSS
ncbi:Sorbitol dehydrogenase [Fusarium oxysporum f. sp. albedinis]|nr:Sorbitol dehydrogenase [Fusarium oxysporum f. sp. albedinis]